MGIHGILEEQRMRLGRGLSRVGFPIGRSRMTPQSFAKAGFWFSLSALVVVLADIIGSGVSGIEAGSYSMPYLVLMTFALVNAGIGLFLQHRNELFRTSFLGKRIRPAWHNQPKSLIAHRIL